MTILSNGARRLTGTSAYANKGCTAGGCASDAVFQSWPGYSTPTLMTFRVLKTTLPVGSYTSTYYVTSPGAGAGLGAITVTPTITKP